MGYEKEAYQILRRAIDDRAFLQSLLKDPDAELENEGIAESSDREQLMQVLRPLCIGLELEPSRLMLNQLRTTTETADAFKMGLKRTVDQIEKAFKSVMTMYIVAFYLGVGLIVASVVFAVASQESLFPIALAGLGTADIIAYFITKPPEDLQTSRANLAQLQAAFFNWFVDVYNWNAYLGTCSCSQGPISFEELSRVSDTLLKHTDDTMALIQKYCELVKGDRMALGSGKTERGRPDSRTERTTHADRPKARTADVKPEIPAS